MRCYKDVSYCSLYSCDNMKCERNRNCIDEKDFEQSGLLLALSDMWRSCDYNNKWGDYRETDG